MKQPVIKLQANKTTEPGYVWIDLTGIWDDLPCGAAGECGIYLSKTESVAWKRAADRLRRLADFAENEAMKSK